MGGTKQVGCRSAGCNQWQLLQCSSACTLHQLDLLGYVLCVALRRYFLPRMLKKFPDLKHEHKDGKGRVPVLLPPACTDVLMLALQQAIRAAWSELQPLHGLLISIIR